MSSNSLNKIAQARKARNAQTMSVETMAGFTQVANAADERKQAEKELKRERERLEKEKLERLRFESDKAERIRRAENIETSMVRVDNMENASWLDWLAACLEPRETFPLDNTLSNNGSKR